MQFSLKVLISALLIAGASEAAKRSAAIGAMLVSLPLVSICAIGWLYVETRDLPRVCAFSYGILWAVLPSAVFFLALPILLRAGVKFWLALPASCVVMAAAYWVYVKALRGLGMEL